MMNNSFVIQSVFENQAIIIGELLRASFDYFTYEPTINEYCEFSTTQNCFTHVATNEKEENLGFICLHMTNENTSEIIVMSVNPAFRRTGVGTLLLEAAERESIKRGNTYLMAKIIGPSQKEPLSLNTYNFFLKHNFCLIAEYDFLWQDCYCGIVAKQIS